jgi:hypothetical protein
MCDTNSLQRGALAVGFFFTALPCLQEVLATLSMPVVQHPLISAYLTPFDLLIFPKLSRTFSERKKYVGGTC